MKYYHYFVSYSYCYGLYGMVDFATSEKISSFDDIVAMQKLIAEKQKKMPCEIIIINYQLISDIPY